MKENISDQLTKKMSDYIDPIVSVESSNFRQCLSQAFLEGYLFALKLTVERIDDE